MGRNALVTADRVCEARQAILDAGKTVSVFAIQGYLKERYGHSGRPSRISVILEDLERVLVEPKAAPASAVPVASGEVESLLKKVVQLQEDLLEMHRASAGEREFLFRQTDEVRQIYMANEKALRSKVESNDIELRMLRNKVGTLEHELAKARGMI